MAKKPPQPGGIVTMSPQAALHAMSKGAVPARLRITGSLGIGADGLFEHLAPRALPTEELVAENIVINDGSRLTQLPRVIRCRRLAINNYQGDVAADCIINIIPDEQKVTNNLVEFTLCRQLTRLPTICGPLYGLNVHLSERLIRLPALPSTVRNLWLRRCPGLTGFDPQQPDLHLESCVLDWCDALDLASLAIETQKLTYSRMQTRRELAQQCQASDELQITDCPHLIQLPAGIAVRSLTMSECHEIRELPANLRVSDEITIEKCSHLTRLPPGFSVNSMKIEHCLRLRALPSDLSVQSLSVKHCAHLTRWNNSDVAAMESLVIEDCPDLEALSPNIQQIQQMTLTDCRSLKRLPQHVNVAELHIQKCPALKVISGAWRITDELRIYNCAGLTRLQAHIVAFRATITLCPELFELPTDFFAQHLVIENCSGLTRWGNPDVVDMTRLVIANCKELAALPPNLRQIDEMEIRSSTSLRQLPQRLEIRKFLIRENRTIRELPAGLNVSDSFYANDCPALTHLPVGIAAHTVSLRDCAGLLALPDDLAPVKLDLTGCSSLTHWDNPNITEMEMLDATNCQALNALPPNLQSVGELNITNCARLASLPANLQRIGQLMLTRTRLRDMPPAAHGAVLRWGNIEITEQIAFHPETITAQQVMDEENAELRRIMFERMGAERFFAETEPEIRDSDTDRGGQRRLLATSLEFVMNRRPRGHGDRRSQPEPYVALEVRDPSTDRVYLLRVPPWMRTCHQAAAWIAGFDDPNAYQPVMET